MEKKAFKLGGGEVEYYAEFASLNEKEKRFERLELAERKLSRVYFR